MWSSQGKSWLDITIWESPAHIIQEARMMAQGEQRDWNLSKYQRFKERAVEALQTLMATQRRDSLRGDHTNTAWGGTGARRVSDTGRTDVPNTTGRSHVMRIIKYFVTGPAGRLSVTSVSTKHLLKVLQEEGFREKSCWWRKRMCPSSRVLRHPDLSGWKCSLREVGVPYLTSSNYSISKTIWN